MQQSKVIQADWTKLQQFLHDSVDVNRLPGDDLIFGSPSELEGIRRVIGFDNGGKLDLVDNWLDEYTADGFKPLLTIDSEGVVRLKPDVEIRITTITNDVIVMREYWTLQDATAAIDEIFSTGRVVLEYPNVIDYLPAASIYSCSIALTKRHPDLGLIVKL